MTFTDGEPYRQIDIGNSHLSGGRMRICYGFSGAILGAFSGFLIALASLMASDIGSMEGIFLMLFFGPIGILAGGWLGAIGALRIFDFLRHDANINPDWTPVKILLVACLYLGYPMLGIAVLQGAITWHTTLPSDQTLIADFHSHEATYMQIIQMQEADKSLTRVSMSETEPVNPPLAGIPNARIDEYRGLLQKINVPDGFDTQSNGGIEFENWSIGEATTSDTGKGIIYLPTPQLPILASLDNCQRGGDQRLTAYRHIEGNWYLYFDYVPE